MLLDGLEGGGSRFLELRGIRTCSTTSLLDLLRETPSKVSSVCSGCFDHHPMRVARHLSCGSFVNKSNRLIWPLSYVAVYRPVCCVCRQQHHIDVGATFGIGFGKLLGKRRIQTRESTFCPTTTREPFCPLRYREPVLPNTGNPFAQLIAQLGSGHRWEYVGVSGTLLTDKTSNTSAFGKFWHFLHQFQNGEGGISPESVWAGVGTDDTNTYRYCWCLPNFLPNTT